MCELFKSWLYNYKKYINHKLSPLRSSMILSIPLTFINTDNDKPFCRPGDEFESWLQRSYLILSPIRIAPWFQAFPDLSPHTIIFIRRIGVSTKSTTSVDRK
uniref:Uncharacterized protein n=1 Tax=Cacopsylla melanoneura TaxID=428564 RepID=A0A8D8W5J3_9HEMI